MRVQVLDEADNVVDLIEIEPTAIPAGMRWRHPVPQPIVEEPATAVVDAAPEMVAVATVDEDPVAKLVAFLNANPDVKALLQ